MPKPLSKSSRRSNFGEESLSLFVSSFHAVVRGTTAGRHVRVARQRSVCKGGAARHRGWGCLSDRVDAAALHYPSPHIIFGNERVGMERRGCWMMGAVPARPYVSARGVAQLRERLSERDLAIIWQVAELRLMSARQIQAVQFPLDEHGSLSAATRARQRVLQRLIRERVLAALERRIGGVRAGSAGLVLALGSLGQRLLALDGPRRRAYEPSLRFVDHTLAVAQVIVDVQVAARVGRLELLDCQAEPQSWRHFSDIAGQRVLRPDAFVALGVGEYELRWFIEVDRGSESLPVIRRKCQLYAAYYQSGREQTAHGVFPRVCWIAPAAARAERLAQAIVSDRHLPTRLFVVTTATEAEGVLREVTRAEPERPTTRSHDIANKSL